MTIVWISRAPDARSKPNILLITLDTTRWDHLSCYGHSVEITPTLDKLAGEGVKYEHAITPSSWTLSAHASLFTGMLPTHHNAHFGIDQNAETDETVAFTFYPLHPTLPTLAGELRKAGYYTRGVTGGPTLDSDFGFGHGFDHYDDRLPKGESPERHAGVVTFLATRWLKEYCSNPDAKPFFLFLNYFDPHNPYQAPAPWGNSKVPEELFNLRSPRYDDVFSGNRDLTDEERRILLSQYSDEVRFMDNQIGRLFDEMKRLGVYDSTLIVATSDHGESFGEHRLLEHGRALYEELIRVPLIIKYPSRDEKRSVVERRVSILSIMPTLLHYIGHPIPKTVECGTLDEGDQLLIAEIYRDIVWIKTYGERFDRDQKTIYDGNHKWIWQSNGEHELYEISEDPEEKNNLFGKLPDVERRFQSRLVPLIEESKKLSSITPPQIDKELQQRLKALGYTQ
ncbi:MAG: sulfatase [Candidatus Hydrogenedentota bacterium]|nr:MAG: sulfatase [Candidatus Hydrogenedentota bacterium]